MNYHGERTGDESVGQLFTLAARLSGTIWVRTLHESVGLGWTAFNILRALENADGQTVKEVSAATAVAASTLTGVLDTLEKDGLVERRRSTADRRVVHLHLTGAGRDRLTASAEGLGEKFDAYFDHVTPDDEPHVRRFLAAVIDRFSTELGSPRRRPLPP